MLGQDDCWDILGIAPIREKKAIKKAYAKKLKITRPDSDPEGFKRLNTAYQDALNYLNYEWYWEEDDEDEDDYDVFEQDAEDGNSTRHDDADVNAATPAVNYAVDPQPLDDMWVMQTEKVVEITAADVSDAMNEALQSVPIATAKSHVASQKDSHEDSQDSPVDALQDKASQPPPIATPHVTESNPVCEQESESLSTPVATPIANPHAQVTSEDSHDVDDESDRPSNRELEYELEGESDDATTETQEGSLPEQQSRPELPHTEDDAYDDSHDLHEREQSQHADTAPPVDEASAVFAHPTQAFYVDASQEQADFEEKMALLFEQHGNLSNADAWHALVSHDALYDIVFKRRMGTRILERIITLRGDQLAQSEENKTKLPPSFIPQPILVMLSEFFGWVHDQERLENEFYYQFDALNQFYDDLEAADAPVISPTEKVSDSEAQANRLGLAILPKRLLSLGIDAGVLVLSWYVFSLIDRVVVLPVELLVMLVWFALLALQASPLRATVGQRVCGLQLVGLYTNARVGFMKVLVRHFTLLFILSVAAFSLFKVFGFVMWGAYFLHKHRSNSRFTWLDDDSDTCVIDVKNSSM